MHKARTFIRGLVPDKALKTRRNYLISRNLVERCQQFIPGKYNYIESELHTIKRFLFPQKTISLYPLIPTPDSVIFDLCAYLNYKIVKGPSVGACREVMYYNSTFKDIHEIRKGILNLDRAINGKCLNISKKKVQDCFKESFGYALEIDPLSFKGEMLKKSDFNFRHDGEIIEAPVAPSEVEKNYVYQKSINNKYDDRYYLDYRVPVMGRDIPLVYKKYRPAERRFKDVSHTEIVKPTDVFSAEEIKQILHFAALMKLDFGELDVLRDNDNQRIYIVDANDTPYYASLSNELRKTAIPVLAKSFEKLIQS